MCQPNTRCIALAQAYEYCQSGIASVLRQCVEQDVRIKAWMTVEVLFRKIDVSTGEVDREVVSFLSTSATPILWEEDIREFISNTRVQLDEEIETFTNNGSNWIVGHIPSVIVKLVSFK